MNFSEFQFVTYDHDPNEVHVEYEKVGMKDNLYIIDNNGKVLETMSVKSSVLKVADVYPYTFTRSVKYGWKTVEFNMNVELLNKGSIRQINSYQGGYVGIGTSVTNTRLERSHHNVWSPNGFPTIELYYVL